MKIFPAEELEIQNHPDGTKSYAERSECSSGL